MTVREPVSRSPEVKNDSPISLFKSAPVITLQGEPAENLFVFIKTSKKRGIKLEELAQRCGGILANYIPIQTTSGVEQYIQQILEKYEGNRDGTEAPLIRLMLAGNDSFINAFVRLFVELLSVSSRSWHIDNLRFLLLPVGINVDVARQIAATDPEYRGLFFCPEWEQYFAEPSDVTVSPERDADILARIEHYATGSHEVHQFVLGEAFITQTKQTAQEMVKVPFIKSIRVGHFNPQTVEETKEKRNKVDKEDSVNLSEPNILGGSVDRNALPEVELQVDYWALKKKGEAQVSLKGMFSMVGVTRLPGLCSVWRMEPQHRPTPASFSMLLQFRDRRRGFKATVAKAGMKLESHSQRPHSVQSKITKLTCSLPADTSDCLRGRYFEMTLLCIHSF